MIPILRSELRKLFTVRSTYFMMALAVLFTVGICFYFEGYKGNTGSPASELAPTALKEIVANSAGLGALLVAIIGILFMAHEYRYNTIMYTLTAAGRRTKVLIGKVVIIAVFGAAFGLVTLGAGLGAYLWGVSLRGASLPAQDFNILAEMGRVTYYFAAYALVGLALATIVRSITAAIAIIFIFSTTIEPLLGVLLKENAKYLPFTSLDATVGASIQSTVLSPGAAIAASAAYVGGLLLIAWLLFVRRDVS